MAILVSDFLQSYQYLPSSVGHQSNHKNLRIGQNMGSYTWRLVGKHAVFLFYYELEQCILNYVQSSAT